MLMSNFKLFAQRLFANVPPLKKQKKKELQMWCTCTSTIVTIKRSRLLKLSWKPNESWMFKIKVILHRWYMDKPLGNSNQANLLASQKSKDIFEIGFFFFKSTILALIFKVTRDLIRSCFKTLKVVRIFTKVCYWFTVTRRVGDLKLKHC